MLKYIGDISREDACLLEWHASRSRIFVEFGAGASTQVIAQSLPEDGHLYTFETDPVWVDRTNRRLFKLGVQSRVTMLPYESLNTIMSLSIDVAFDDGRDNLRMEFATRIWTALKIGGCLLMHDTKRPGDVQNVLQLIKRVFLEVATVHFNQPLDGKASNITCIYKKYLEPYIDWNVAESRANWMLGPLVEPEEFWANSYHEQPSSILPVTKDFRFHPNEENEQVMSLLNALCSKKWLYRRIGYDDRQMAFHCNGHITQGAAGCEQTWNMVPINGQIQLHILGKDGLTCALVYDAGIWRGQWLIHERMPIELVE